MKSSKTKKVILILLAAVAAFVWYDNVTMMYSSSETSQRNEVGTKSSPTGTVNDRNSLLTFIPPKVNPFKEPVSKPKQTNKRTKPAPSPDPIPPAPSALYQLVGYLDNDANVTATLADKTGKQILVATGDSVAGWELQSINDEQIIFAYKKHRDTLSRNDYQLPPQ